MRQIVLICAQDIRELHLGLIKEGDIHKEAHHNVPPEAYLKEFAKTLESWGVPLDEIDEIIVVTGPGSFTASRVSVTIANTLAFTRGIDLRGVENKEMLSLKDLWSNIKEALPEPTDLVLPSYDSEAIITQPKIK